MLTKWFSTSSLYNPFAGLDSRFSWFHMVYISSREINSMLITILGSAKLTNMICDLYNFKSTLSANLFWCDVWIHSGRMLIIIISQIFSHMNIKIQALVSGFVFCWTLCEGDYQYQWKGSNKSLLRLSDYYWNTLFWFQMDY